MSTKIVQNFINGILIAVSIISAIAIAIFSINKFDDIYSIVAGIVEAIDVLVFLYTNWLWRFLNFFGIPVISGKYDVENIPSRGENAKTVKGTAKITQTLFVCNITCTFDESRSYSKSACYIKEENQIVYNFFSKTDEKHKNINPDKYGTVYLEKIDKNNLKGEYYTSKPTTGDIHFVRINRK